MIKDIFKQNRVGILVTYFVLAFENLIFALYPFLFGRAIDGLLSGNYEFFNFYIGIFLVGIMVGVFRRVFDTRIFAKVWLKVGTNVISSLMSKDVESSKIITRASLSTRYVDFFEFYIPNAFRGFVSLITSLVMLWIVVPQVIGWVLLMSSMALMFSHYVSVKRKKYDHIITGTEDESNQAIQDRNQESVHKAYMSRTTSYVKMSDWEAGGWCFADLLWLVSEVVVVLTLIKMECTTGIIISTTAYVGMLYGNIGTISYFFMNLRAIEVANEKIAECSEGKGGNSDSDCGMYI